MSSKMAPLWLCFDTVRPAGLQYQVLFKCGDDLRQDQLVLQSLSLFDRIWKQSGLNLGMIPYGCIATGLEVGLIEVVPNATTIASILSKTHGEEKLTITGAIASSFGQSMETTFSIRKWLSLKEQANASPSMQRRSSIEEEDEARETDRLALEADILAGQANSNSTQQHSDAYMRKYPISYETETLFIRSCAGYCVATYVLGIGDRHPSNIMLKEDGRLFHIDFGHFLGNFKSKFGVKRETSPFVFTPQFAAVFGGPQGERYEEFCQVCCDAYNCLRRENQLIISLFRLMIGSGLPEVSFLVFSAIFFLF
jgi:phosphatidylinositol kinase/protein kinase (PI-3  family)